MIGATFCSGIGTPELACPAIDWRFASEIEKFPRAVLKHRFGMKEAGFGHARHTLWGDLTTVRIRHFRRLGIPLPEVIVAGLPCQAFSIAGLRKSLSDDRGNLTLRFLRLLHGFRAAGSLRNFVFENVPGILNTGDNVFGCFLAGLVGADDPLVPPDAEWGPKTHFDRRSHDVHRTYGWKSCGWPSEGMVEGPLGRAAWRVFDAQHFGLAQRRKRVFVVYDTGKGADPAAILFERKSLHRYSPKSGEERQGIAPTISARTKGGGGLGTDFDLDGGQTAVPDQQQAFGGGNTSGPRRVSAALAAHGQRIDFEVETFVVAGHGDYRRGEAPTLRAAGGDAQGGSEALVKHPTYAIQERAVSENPDTGPQGKGYQEEVAYTLEARNKVQGVDHPLSGGDARVDHALRGEGFDASEDGTGRGTPIVPVPPAIPINLQVATRHNALGRGTGFGIGEPDEPAFTLSKSHSHGDAVADGPVAFSMRGRDGGSVPEIEDGGVAPVVRTPGGGSSQTFIAFSSKDHGADAMEELSPTLRAGGHNESHANAGTPPPVAFNARQDPISSDELSPPIDTDASTVGVTDSGWRVRRLTVVECEKLQGLPVNHTLIPWRGNREEPDFSQTVAWLMSHGLSEEEAVSLAGVPDGPRYKSIGNGMAKPVIGWILNRIVQFMPGEKDV